jgi:ABC-type Fe3+-hydroxamate transport system substrate-binding protein
MAGRPPGLVASLLVLLASACSDAPPEDGSSVVGGFEVVDAAGTVHHMEGPARRIVSLVPSATLTLGAMGAGDLLVARTDYDTAQWVAHLPSVGGGLQPSHEALLAIQPDLVIRFAGEQDVETPAVLDQVGIRHIAIRPDRIADIRDATTLLGVVSGHGEEAAVLVDELDRTLAQVRAQAETRDTVRVAYVLGGTPPWVAGGGTFVDEVLEIAGGLNVFRDLGRLYASVSPEEFVARDIDVVLTTRATSLPVGLLTGVRVVEVGDLLELPGPDVGDVARRVAAILAGDGGA